MTTILDRFRAFVRTLFGQVDEAEEKKEEIVKGLVKGLQMTKDREMACEDVFEIIDQYAELVVNGENPEEVMPLVHHHLAMCGHCREEVEMLLEMMNFKLA